MKKRFAALGISAMALGAVVLPTSSAHACTWPMPGSEPPEFVLEQVEFQVCQVKEHMGYVKGVVDDIRP